MNTDAFGVILGSHEDIPNRLLYGGQQYDAETEQYYLRARYYNSVIGQFMQEDTYRGDGLNLYAYCANNPVMYHDPSGRNAVCVHAMDAEKNAQRENVTQQEIGKDGESKTGNDFIVAPGGVVYTAEDFAKMTDFEQPSTLYHYTTENGLQGILESESLYPSIKTSTSKDARMGSGQYLTDIVPGSKTDGQVSRSLFGIPWNTNKVAYYIEIDVSGLNIMKGRNGVYYIPGEANLDLTNRIVSFGKTGG